MDYYEATIVDILWELPGSGKGMELWILRTVEDRGQGVNSGCIHVQCSYKIYWLDVRSVELSLLIQEGMRLNFGSRR